MQDPMDYKYVRVLNLFVRKKHTIKVTHLNIPNNFVLVFFPYAKVYD